MNCLRRTTVFGAESTAVNTIKHGGKDDAGAVDDRKENLSAVLAIKEEILPLEYVDPEILATPSRARERRDAPLSVTRTPGQRECVESCGSVRLTFHSQHERRLRARRSYRQMLTWNRRKVLRRSPQNCPPSPIHHRQPSLERASRPSLIRPRWRSTHSACSQVLQHSRHRG